MTSRTLTVLFTDLVDSTALVTKLEPERSDSVISRHFAGLRSAIAVHRGREVKALGDGLMVVFESVADGLACAVTMQRSVARQNESDSEVPLAMRVGVSTGEVTEGDDDFFGPPVIEASRLCGVAGPRSVLATEMVSLLAGGSGVHRLKLVGEMSLKGLPVPVRVCELVWDDDGGSAMRVALAEDSALLRQSVAQVLEAAGMEVVLQTEDADSLLEGLAAARPHVVVLDVRMPPTHTTEGLDAAARIRNEQPHVAVLVLSGIVSSSAAEQLLKGGTEGVGYLLKDRVGDVDELTSAIRTVAGGGSAIDPEVVAELSAAA